MRLTKSPFLFFIFSLISFTSYSQAQKALHPDSLEMRIRKVENSLSPLVQTKGAALWNLEAQMKKYNIPGLSMAVINDFSVEWTKGYGTTNNVDKSNVTSQTVFQAASMSKFVNAVALLKLRESENIDLDQDINELLSSWKLSYDQKVSEQPITLRQLLSHTAGLSTHGFNGYKGPGKLPTIIHTLEGKKPANSQKVKPITSPGKKFRYSGGGTTISQLILTDNSNTTYEGFLSEHLFEPLGMNHSFYSIELDKYPKDLAFGHLQNGKTLKNGYNIYPESAAAGLWTTPTDLAKLLIDVQKSLSNENGKILSNQSSKELITPPIKNDNSALGLFLENANAELYLQHSGSNRGFRGKFYMSVENGNGIVVMVNGTDTNIIEEITRSVALVYNWAGFENLEASAKIDLKESDLQSYSGTYALDNRKVTVSLKAGNLSITEKGKWSSPLTPLNESLFVADALRPQVTIEFIKGNDGAISKLLTVQQNESFEWKRVD